MTPPRTPLPVILDAHEPGVADALFSAPFGLFGRQKIKAMIGRKLIQAEIPVEPSQLQPASLDLRLSKEAYRVRASFLPGRERSVRERLESLNAEPVSLAGKGAVLEKGIVYVARLMERLELRPNLSGAANPKSSTGRIDIFTRLIVDRGEAFDEVPLDYKGELWLEISPRSFSVRVKAGTKLNQVRFRSRNSQQRDKHTFTLDDAEIRKRHLARRWSTVPSTCAKAWRSGSTWGAQASLSSATGRSGTATSSTSTACAAMRWRTSGSRYAPARIGG